MVDEPRGSIFGGVVAAPAFAEIAKFDLQYLEIPPDAPQSVAARRSLPLGVAQRAVVAPDAARGPSPLRGLWTEVCARGGSRSDPPAPG